MQGIAQTNDLSFGLPKKSMCTIEVQKVDYTKNKQTNEKNGRCRHSLEQYEGCQANFKRGCVADENNCYFFIFCLIRGQHGYILDQ